MDLLASLSDEQTVLMGCGLMLVASIGMLSLSYHFGAGRQKQETGEADTLRFERREVEAQDESQRRAA